jgi:hypothetical protein
MPKNGVDRTTLGRRAVVGPGEAASPTTVIVRRSPMLRVCEARSAEASARRSSEPG